MADEDLDGEGKGSSRDFKSERDETRKRQADAAGLDEDDAGGVGAEAGAGAVPSRLTQPNKRANSTVTGGILKVLVSGDAAGSIIGKRGATVSALQAKTGARVKLSQNRDCFPGTRFRTVLIQGDQGPLTEAVHYVIECDNGQHKEGMDDTPAAVARGDAVLAVSTNAAGMILGRGGDCLRVIQDQSGARVHITSKDEAIAGERVVTISGTLAQMLDAVDRILAKMHEDLEQCVYQNNTTSYAYYTGAAPPPSGPGRATPGSLGPIGGGRGAGGGAGAGAASMYGQQYQAYGAAPAVYGQQSYGGAAPTPSPYASFGASGGAAAAYGAQPAYAGAAQPAANPYAVAPTPSYGAPGGAPGGFGQQQAASAYGHPQAAAYGAPGASMGHPAAAAAASYGSVGQPAGDAGAITLPVPDSHVGLLVGRGGSTIQDFQMRSGARIRISQKGEYIPGTMNRTVTITGAPQSVQMAQYFVNQKLSEITYSTSQPRF